MWSSFRNNQQVIRQSAGLIELALGESPRNARSIARQAFRTNRVFYRDYRWLATQSETVVTNRLRSVRLVNGEALQQYCRSRPDRPKILLSIHMGPYLLGMMKLYREAPEMGPVHIVKRESASEMETRAYRHFPAGGLPPVNVIRLGQHNLARQCLRALGRGENVMLMLDVPRSFAAQRRLTVDWLGADATLPAGAAELAYRCGASVVPLVTCRQDNRIVTRVEPPVDPLAFQDHEQPVQALAQKLAQVAEGWIRQAPADWMLWPHLPDLWQVPAGDEASSAPTLAL